MMAYIRTPPCDLCNSRRTIHDEPPFDVCVQSRFGDFEPLDEMTGEGCEKLAAAEDLSAMAVEAAERWRVKMRHTPAAVRERQIGGFADFFSDHAADIGGEFDARSWIADCAPVRKARAAA